MFQNAIVIVVAWFWENKSRFWQLPMLNEIRFRRFFEQQWIDLGLDKSCSELRTKGNWIDFIYDLIAIQVDFWLSSSILHSARIMQCPIIAVTN